MIKELNDKGIMQDLENILDEFLMNLDCQPNRCHGCKYDQICGTICNLGGLIMLHNKINN